MAETFKPVPVYFAHDAARIEKYKWTADYVPYKTLTANTADELAHLQKIGWTLEQPK